VRALQAVEFGLGPDGARLREVAEPIPAADEVLIKVAAVSASHLDLSVLSGRMAGVQPPRTLGIDPAGTVVALGSGVDPSLLGAAVVVKPNIFCGVCSFCRSGRESDCLTQPILGVHLDGGAADLVAVPVRSAFRLPAGMPAALAAATVHTVPVALHMLRLVLPPSGDLTGSSVLVTGAAGAVGSAAVQLVKALGGTAIGVVRGADRVAAVCEIGADHVLDAQDPDLAVRVRALTGGGADVVVETTGSPAVVGRSFDALGWTGRMITCTGSGAQVHVDLGELYRNRRGLQGTAGSDAADVVRALAMVAAGQVRPLISRTVALADYAGGYAAFDDRRRSGRIVFSLDN